MSYWKMTSPSQTLLIEFPHKRIRFLLAMGRKENDSHYLVTL
jgi:hypothetical protein